MAEQRDIQSEITAKIIKFKAAAQAQKAVDFLHDLQGQQEVAA